MNRFNIADYTPRDKGQPLFMSQKSKRNQLKKNNVAIGIEDEDDVSNFDEFVADFEKKKKEEEDNVMTE